MQISGEPDLKVRQRLKNLSKNPRIKFCICYANTHTLKSLDS